MNDVTSNNHGGNSESIAAFNSISERIPALRAKVLRAVESSPATVKEVVSKTGLPRLTVGARLTELKIAGLIQPTADRREGCRVLGLSLAGRELLKRMDVVTFPAFA